MPAREVLTLKYRPQTFAELMLQDHVRNTLVRAIEHNRLANAYLFAGPRGVGKTTTARILAKCLNCLSFDHPTVTPCNQCSACVEIAESRSMDVLEIDGASNRGIDQVRELRENIRYSPASLRYKIYIIDEVHMLTTEAFNALLKTLEEPPPHAKFIFATTAPNRLPLTILSRCQRFDFRKATPGEIIQRLQWIAQKENIKISPEALTAIARRADGAIRDAEGLLEQLRTYSPEGIELEHVEELLGLVPTNIFFEYADLIADAAPRPIFQFIDRLFTSGYDFIEFYSGAVNHFRNLLLFKIGGEDPESGFLPQETQRLKEQAAKFSTRNLMKIIDTLSRNEAAAKHSLLPRVLLEIVSLQFLNANTEASPPPTESATTSNKKNQPPVDPTPPPPPPTTEDTPLNKLWLQFCALLNARRPVLARILELAQPVSWENGTLTVALAPEYKGIARQLTPYQQFIESLICEITGKPSRFKTTVAKTTTQPDQTMSKLTQYFGEVEEI